MEEDRKFTAGNNLDWYGHYIALDIELLNAYIEQCEISNIAAIVDYHKHKEFESFEYEMYGACGSSCNINFRGIDGGTFNAEYIYKYEFPNMNRQSNLVMTMGLFEKRLKELCDWIYNNFQLNKKFIKKETVSLLLSIKNYLEIEAELYFSEKLNQLWGDLMTLQTIKNNIAHNYGIYELRNSYVDEYIRKNNNITIEQNHGTIILNHLFLTDLIPFFIELFKELQSTITNRKIKN